MFEEFINKKVKINLELDSRILKYTATILEVSEDHIRFIDKEDKEKVVRKDCIIDISLIKVEGGVENVE